MRNLRYFLAAELALATASGGERKLELRGRIEPAPHRAIIMLHGATTPFSARTEAGPGGRFRFRNLTAGAYSIFVSAAGEGEVRQTLEVSPAFADSKGRVEVTISFSPGAAGAVRGSERRSKVSVRQLAIPERASREYEEAEKRLGERDVKGAIKRLERAVEIAPQFVEAWNHLGTIAYQSGRFEDAERYFRKALEYEPGSYAPLVNLGGTLLSMRKYSEALPYNQRAVKDRPDDALANSQLGMNFFFLGDQDKALKYLAAAVRLDPSHFSHPQLLLAEIHLRRNDTAKAVEQLKDFVARHPDDPSAERLRKQIEILGKPNPQ